MFFQRQKRRTSGRNEVSEFHTIFIPKRLENFEQLCSPSTAQHAIFPGPFREFRQLDIKGAIQRKKASREEDLPDKAEKKKKFP